MPLRNFLSRLLKQVPVWKDDLRKINSLIMEKNSLAVYLLVFLLVAVGIAGMGYASYKKFEAHYRSQIESQLVTTGSLKEEELHHWRVERLTDANLFYRNENFSARVRQFLETPQDSEARVRLIEWLEKLQAIPEYDRVFLLDIQGIERVSLPAAPDAEAVPAALIEQAAECLASDQIVFLDFHRHTENGPIHLAILVPIYDPQEDNLPLGVLVLRIDPYVYLYPFIQSWPTPSASAETLLARQEGEEVLILNALRFQQDAALNLRLPLDSEEIPMARAVLGFEGVLEGMDYRGAPVIAAAGRVPDSPWFLVSKMDTAEIYAPLRERLWQTVIFLSVLALAAGAGLGLAWRQQRVSHYRAQVQAMDALRASEEKFRLAFDTSPNSVAITRARDGMFVSVNKGFEQITGYTRAEVIGKTSLEINVWKDPEDRRKIVEGLQAGGEVRDYEASFLTRDGEIIGLMSAAIIQLDGEPHILNITRDITERKQAEQAILAGEKRYHGVLDAMMEGCQIIDYDWRYVYLNEVAANQGKYRAEELLNRTMMEMYPGIEETEMFSALKRCMEDRAPSRMENRFVYPDGNIGWFELSIQPAEEGIFVLSEDITERKQAEEKLKESLTLLRIAEDTAKLGGWSVDLEQNRSTWSDQVAAIHGMPAGFSPLVEEGIGFYAPEWREKITKVFTDCAQNGIPYNEEMEIITAKGKRVWVQTIGEAVRDERGKIFKVHGAFQDITERKQAEEALVSSEAKYRRLFDQQIAVNQLALALGELRDLDEVYQIIHEYVQVLMDTDAFIVAFYDSETQLIHAGYVISGGEVRDAASFPPIPLEEVGHGTQSRVIHTGEPFYCPDWRKAMAKTKTKYKIAENGKVSEGPPPSEEQEGSTNSALYVPMKVKGEIIGVMQVQSHRIDAYSQEDIGLLAAMANVAAVAIQNARLFEDIQHELIERKQAEENLKASELRFRSAAECLTDIIYEWDLKDRITWYGEIDEMMGYPAGEFPRTLEGWSALLHPDDREMVLATTDNHLKRGVSYEVEYRVQKRDGEWLWWSARGLAIRNEGGEPYQWIGSITNITERKQSEQALLESEDKFKYIFDRSMVAKSITQPSGEINVNQAFCKMLGYSMEELQGPRWKDITHPEDVQASQEEIDALLSHEKEFARFVKRYIHKDGSTVWADVSTSLRWDDDGKPLYFMTAVLDITERVRTEQALQETEARYRALVEQIPAIIYRDSAEHTGQTLYISPQIQSVLGYEPGDWMADNDFWAKIMHPDDRERVLADYAQANETGKSLTTEYRLAAQDGREVWVRDEAALIHDPSGNPLFWQGVLFDITERKQAEEKLIVSEGRYRRLFEAARDGILILDAETGIVTDVNPFLVEMLGLPREKIYGKELWELGFFKDIAANKANFLELQKKEFIRYEDLPLETADGRRFQVEFVSNVYQVNHHKVIQCNIRDITERKQAEEQLARYTEKLEEMVDERTRSLRDAQEQLIRQERLAMLGQVAGSIGHELRNPLGVISNAIYFLKLTQPDASAKIKEYLDIIENETRTSDKIVTGLLDFTRIKSMERKQISIPTLARQTLERYPTPAFVQTAFKIPEDLPAAYADPHHVVQVLGNLVTNACQAMPEGGELVLIAGLNDDMITIAVRDTGIGIPPENLQKIFEPLFTTKSRGIGLGLAVSQKLAEANGGRIEVQSEPGKGSVFTLYLPVYKE